MQHSESKLNNMKAASITVKGNLPTRLLFFALNIKKGGKEQEQQGQTEVKDNVKRLYGG